MVPVHTLFGPLVAPRFSARRLDVAAARRQPGQEALPHLPFEERGGEEEGGRRGKEMQRVRRSQTSAAKGRPVPLRETTAAADARSAQLAGGGAEAPGGPRPCGGPACALAAGSSHAVCRSSY